MWTSSDLDVAPLVHALQQIIHHQAPDVAAPRGRVRPRGQRALGHHGAEGLAQPLDVFGKGGAGAERRTRALPERRRHSPAACVHACLCTYTGLEISTLNVLFYWQGFQIQNNFRVEFKVPII